ncbi:hypothetical protein LG3211_2320 [Lysobacter gummosus]|nr:hypothetical protein LG3211_2320 [Lysobacter gummosus]
MPDRSQRIAACRRAGECIGGNTQSVAGALWEGVLWEGALAPMLFDQWSA